MYSKVHKQQCAQQAKNNGTATDLIHFKWDSLENCFFIIILILFVHLVIEVSNIFWHSGVCRLTASLVTWCAISLVFWWSRTSASWFGTKLKNVQNVTQTLLEFTIRHQKWKISSDQHTKKSLLVCLSFKGETMKNKGCSLFCETLPTWGSGKNFK